VGRRKFAEGDDSDRLAIKLPMEAFLVVRTASGIPVMVLMLVFSYRFPGWYWARAMEKL
jgi:hypothetical protein